TRQSDVNDRTVTGALGEVFQKPARRTPACCQLAFHRVARLAGLPAGRFTDLSDMVCLISPDFGWATGRCAPPRRGPVRGLGGASRDRKQCLFAPGVFAPAGAPD